MAIKKYIKAYIILTFYKNLEIKAYKKIAHFT